MGLVYVCMDAVSNRYLEEKGHTGMEGTLTAHIEALQISGWNREFKMHPEG